MEAQSTTKISNESHGIGDDGKGGLFQELTMAEKLQLCKDLTCPDGFHAWVEFLYRSFEFTYKEAFSIICALFIDVVGRGPLYLNFDSWRRARGYHLEKERQKSV